MTVTIDPNADKLVKDYQSVFQIPIDVVKSLAQDVDWTSLLQEPARAVGE